MICHLLSSLKKVAAARTERKEEMASEKTVTSGDANDSDRIFSELKQACLSPSAARLQTLLSKPDYASLALSFRTIPYNLVTITERTTTILLQTSCSAPIADNASTVLAFCADHGIVLEKTIDRDAIINCIENTNPGASLAIFKVLAGPRPDVTSMYLEHLGDPLSYSIHKHHDDETGGRALIGYLLENGADPNNVVCSYTGPGHHIQRATQYASIPIVSLLLQYGAVVKGSGAMTAAAVTGVIEMLALLVEHGGDVNERGKDIQRVRGSMGKRSDPRQEESVLAVALQEGKTEAAEWLEERGATRDPSEGDS